MSWYVFEEGFESKLEKPSESIEDSSTCRDNRAYLESFFFLFAFSVERRNVGCEQMLVFEGCR